MELPPIVLRSQVALTFAFLLMALVAHTGGVRWVSLCLAATTGLGALVIWLLTHHGKQDGPG